MALDPSQKASAFAANTTTYYKVDALKGGTSAMRVAGQSLLPKHPEEAQANYDKRLSTSTLVNYYVSAIDNAVGRAFQKELQVQNLPAALSPLLEDIDGSGSTLEQFGQEALWNCIHHGAHYIAADYPTLEVLPNTLADAAAIDARPYLTTIDAPNVLAAYPKVENGQERLAHFRWIGSEVVHADEGLSEKSIQVVKAYNQEDKGGPVTLTVWKLLDSGWTKYEPTTIVGVSEIPVVPAYGWRTGFFVGKPVLSDLADLNIAHWQSLSEQTHILSVARVPFLHVSGDNLNSVTANSDGSSTMSEFKLSVHSAAVTPKDTSITWVETSGISINAGAENIKYFEEKMAELSLTLNTSTSGDATATATAINAAEAHAVLKSLCVSFSQAMSKALFFLSEFAGSSAPTVRVELDLTVDVPTADTQKQDTQAISAAQDNQSSN